LFGVTETYKYQIYITKKIYLKCEFLKKPEIGLIIQKVEISGTNVNEIWYIIRHKCEEIP